MSDTKISALPAVTVPADADEFAVNQSGISKKETLAQIRAGRVADQGTFTYIDATEASAPGTPASGYARIYAKTDGRIYSKDDAGVEYGPFDTAGAGGPLLYVDSLAVGATGDEFADVSGWTEVGDASAVAETGLIYDDTALIIGSGRSTLGYYKKAAPDTDLTAYLTVYGVNTNSMMSGFALVNADGDGVGLAWRNGFWTIVVDNWAYSSAPATLAAAPVDWPNASSPYNGAAMVLRLTRSSSTVSAAFSFDGGASWKTNGSSSIGSGDKYFMLGEFYENGPVYMLVGRLTVVT